VVSEQRRAAMSQLVASVEFSQKAGALRRHPDENGDEHFWDDIVIARCTRTGDKAEAYGHDAKSTLASLAMLTASCSCGAGFHAEASTRAYGATHCHTKRRGPYNARGSANVTRDAVGKLFRQPP